MTTSPGDSPGPNPPAAPPFLKLIAHDLRWRILQLLAGSDRRVQELTGALGQPQNLVSYHLQKLRQGQLVMEHQSIADAREIYYSLNFELMDGCFRQMGELLHPVFSPARSQPDHLEGRRVLFVCTHNSARSQIAEGLLREKSHGRVQVFSAGTRPLRVHPLAIQVMAIRGIDIQAQASKGLEVFQNQAFDYVITVCDRARETCPVFPGNPVQIHWSIPDPVETIGDHAAQREAFEQVASQLDSRVKYLLRGMTFE